MEYSQKQDYRLQIQEIVEDHRQQNQQKEKEFQKQLEIEQQNQEKMKD